MKKSGIYVITNILNNKKYVGSSVNTEKRLYNHKNYLINNKHQNSKLQNAWNKYGSINFKFELLEECSTENLLVREQHYLDTWNLVEDGYNICLIAGSGGVEKHTEESKRKMSEKLKGKIPWNKNKPMSEGQKKKLSLIKIGKKTGRIPWNKGVPCSEESKQNISNKLKLYYKKLKEE